MSLTPSAMPGGACSVIVGRTLFLTGNKHFASRLPVVSKSRFNIAEGIFSGFNFAYFTLWQIHRLYV
jgi:hypothetical protein